MKEIIETNHIESDRSAFLIDLVKHRSGRLFIEISQKLYTDNGFGQSLKINPLVLDEIIRVLQNYKSRLPQSPTNELAFLTSEEKEKIQKWYLRGVSIEDLAAQIGQPADIIERVLRNNGVEIVPNEVPRRKWNKGRKFW